MEEIMNETNVELENHELECVEECAKNSAHTDKNKSKYKGTGLLKASVALMFASSMLSAGVTGYQIIAGSKDKEDSSQNLQSTIGTVSDKKNEAPYISEDGYWVVGGEKTQFKAEGLNGNDGLNGEDGADGEDGVYVKQARVVYNDKWNISSYIMFVMSDDTYITTNVQTNIMNDHYYEASNAEDISILAENYGVSKIRLANDITLTRKLNVEERLNIDLDENTLTYSASSPISVKEDARLVIENGTLYVTSNTGICLAGDDSRLTFEELDVKATATVAEVLGADTRITLKNSTIETIESDGSGYTSLNSAVGSLFKVYGENANVKVKETAISTSLNVIAVDDFAKTIDINVQDCELVSTAHLLDMDTSKVVPTLSLDDETMESSMINGFATSPVVSGNFNFNPEYMGLADKAYSVDGKWVVAEDFADLVARVEAGAVINLTENIDVENVIINKELTLNLNGYSITRLNDTSAQTIRVNAGGDLTINGEGTICGIGNSTYAIALRAHDGGKITINGGTYTNEGAGSDDAYDLIYASKGGQVVINDGVFIGQTPKWLLNLQDNSGSSIVVNGGIFVGYNPSESHTENPVANFVTEGRVVVGNDDMYAVVSPEEFVANINDAELSYVSLHSDIDLVESWIITQELTLNLNGHSITRTNDTSNQTIRVNAGGDLTINGEGTINGVGNSTYAIALRAHDGGKITINGGTYTNEGAGSDDAYDLIYASKGGQVVINGGTFRGQTPKWLLNLQDRTGASIVVNGGTFVGYNPSESHTENPVANFVARDYKVVVNDGVYTVVESVGSIYVTSVAEFETALADNTVTTITLAKDLDFETAKVINRELVLELNGKTLTVKNDTDGSGVFKIEEGGNLTINGDGVINGVGDNNYNMAIWVFGGTCTINGGTYTNIGAVDKDDPNAHFDLIYVKGGNLTINGGEFYGQTPGWLVNTNDNYRDTSTISITGGVFHGFNPANNATEGEGTNYVAEGHIVTRTGDVYVVTAE